jgi:hypothetical protein
MSSALPNMNAKSQTGHQSVKRNLSPRLITKNLSTLLEEYSEANDEGSVEKLSQLAKEIVELISRNRKKVSQSGYHGRHVE